MEREKIKTKKNSTCNDAEAFEEALMGAYIRGGWWRGAVGGKIPCNQFVLSLSFVALRAM